MNQQQRRNTLGIVMIAAMACVPIALIMFIRGNWWLGIALGAVWCVAGIVWAGIRFVSARRFIAFVVGFAMIDALLIAIYLVLSTGSSPWSLGFYLLMVVILFPDCVGYIRYGLTGRYVPMTWSTWWRATRTSSDDASGDA